MSNAADKARIDEALALLSQVVGVDKEEFRKALGDKYDSLKVDGNVPNGEVAEAARMIGKSMKARVGKIGKSINNKVHAGPWPFIAGAAASTLLIGFLVGKRVGARSAKKVEKDSEAA